MDDTDEHDVDPAGSGDGSSAAKLGKKQLAKARLRARKVRIGSIRKRVAVAASVAVAFFSGAVLVRSVSAGGDASPAGTSQQGLVEQTAGSPGSSILDSVTSVFKHDDNGDDHGDDHDDDHGDDDDGGSAVAAPSGSGQSLPAPSNTPAPLVTGQS